VKPPCRSSGFSLVTAIFLLVVVAGLAVFMTRLAVVQQTTVVYGLQGARATQAARSGIEWGVYQSIVNGACAPTSSFSDPAFAGFSIEVQCSQTTHTEGSAPAGTIVTYRLLAVARSGVYGTLDYVQRQIQATVSLDPP
jgi:MSHA biogenesis protein MshP